VGCGSDSDLPQHINVTSNGTYYKVTIDYTTGDRYDMGMEYGRKVLDAVPDYEQLTDSYLKELEELGTALTDLRDPMTAGTIPFTTMIERALEIKKQIDPEYLLEIEGFASILSGGDHDELGDGKLSVNEYLILNLVPDIATSMACSALAVYGDRSVTGETLIGRSTEWFPGTEGQFGALNAVVHASANSKEVVSFGWLGVLGNLVAINSDGLFIANLYSSIGDDYEAEGRRSILLDIRKAMETCTTINEAADYLKDPEKLYGYNHNMFLADAYTARVLENDFNRNRALRSESSALNPGIEWGFTDALACVNSFLLSGNFDNQTGVPVNEDRWANYRTLLDAAGATVDFDYMKSIITYHEPGAGGNDNGDIYGNTTVQSIVYSFADNRLELWLHPHTGDFTDDPQLVDVPMPFVPGGRQGSVVSFSLIESVTSEEILDSQLDAINVGGSVVDRDDGPEAGNILSDIWNFLVKALFSYIDYDCRSYKVTYITQDAHKNKIKATGLVVVPWSRWGHKISVPALSFQHPTQVERKYSPSKRTMSDNELTYQMSLLLAMTGYIVVVADYPGLGDNMDVHPYCQLSLANSVVDMITAGLAWKKDRRTRKTSWNKEVYYMGFSEGGYATMVTAKSLQESEKYPVNAAAMLDGPYSLSVTMRTIMTSAGPEYDAPYFLPYVCAGYDSVYGRTIDKFDYYYSVKSVVEGYTPPKGSSYAKELYKLLDGSHTPTEICDFMELATPYVGPRSILTAAFLNDIEKTESVVVKTLAANDGYHKWNPDMPFKMFHLDIDDYVPVGNMENAVATWAKNEHVEHEVYTEHFPKDWLGSYHAAAMPYAYVYGFLWLDKYAYPERH
jgi:hypothetical protein